MRVALIALIIGLLAIVLFPALPSINFCILIGALGIALIPWRTYPLGFLLIGVAWGCYSAIVAMDDRLDNRLDGQTIRIEGEVAGLPERSQQIVRFHFKNATAKDLKLPATIRLSWYQGQPVIPGERWQLLVRLKYPRGTVNPHVFDYETWLTAKHIGATGTVKEAKRLTPSNGITTWRYQLREAILAQDAMGQGGGLVALVLGDGSAINKSQWRVFQETGTVHLMVISGQHITLLAAFGYFCIAGLVRIGWWPARLPWLPVACAFAMSLALLYGVLAGFEIPVQRACIMLALVLIWRLRFSYIGVITPFLTALAAVLIYDPLASLQAGFWLSFVSVALLLLTFSGRLSSGSWWLNALKVEWVITLGLMPVLMMLLLPISLTAPIANLLAVPIISFISVPLALLGTLLMAIPYLGSFLLWLAGASLNYLFMLLTVIAQVIPAWVAPVAPSWAFLLALVGAILLLSPRGIPVKVFGLLFCMPLVLPHQSVIQYGSAKVIVFDVGQGLAVLIRTAEHNLLYDVAPSMGDFNLGERILVPAVKRLGVTSLDKVIISHADTDHAGGLVPVSEQLTVKQLISGEPTKLSVKLPVQSCASGRRWQWDGVKFSLWQWSSATNGNDASCVLLVEANGEKLLLTGDISSKAEQAWGVEKGQPIDWLLAPHHGSNHSSSKSFIKTTHPHGVIISRGWLNPFHHPSPLVLKRYRAIHAEVVDTALSGAVQINLGEYLPALRERDVKYFWRK